MLTNEDAGSGKARPAGGGLQSQAQGFSLSDTGLCMFAS